MPFVRLADNHRCKTPETRADGSKLQIGDVWLCDYRKPETERVCGRFWRWVDAQIDGPYWSELSPAQVQDLGIVLPQWARAELFPVTDGKSGRYVP